MNSKLNLKPESKGERWYLYVINQSRNKRFAVYPLIIGVIFLTAHYFRLLYESASMLVFGVMCILASLLSLERYFGYKILKRQQDQIDELTEKSSNQTSGGDVQ